MTVTVNYLLISIDVHLSVDIIALISTDMHVSVAIKLLFHLQIIYALWTLLRYRGMDYTMNICLSTGFTYEVTIETTAELSISCPIEIL